MGHKTTSANFDLFRKKFLIWLSFLNLKQWSVDVVHEKPPIELKGALSTCESNLEDRYAKVTFVTDWGESEPTDGAIKDAALHEALELLMSPLDILARERYIQETDINNARHEIINTIQHTVFNYIRNQTQSDTSSKQNR